MMNSAYIYILYFDGYADVLYLYFEIVRFDDY